MYAWVNHVMLLVCNQITRISSAIKISTSGMPTLNLRAWLIFTGGLGLVHVKFSVWKSLCPILIENKQKILSYHCWGWKKFKFNDYFSPKKYVSYHFLDWSQPPSKYWPVPYTLDTLCGQWILSFILYQTHSNIIITCIFIYQYWIMYSIPLTYVKSC